MSAPIVIIQANFKEIVLDAKQPVLVDFWAPWCGPCRALAPIIDELAGEYAGKVIFAKANVDENSSLASQYSIASIPTIILFNKGKPVEQMVGGKTKVAFQKILDAILGK